jgi:hypothetical protein
MATLSDSAFQFLSLCGSPPGSAAVAQRLSSALSAVPSFDELATAAEQHGMEPLVLAHIERTGLAIPADHRSRLRARRTQHSHAAAVRARVVADVSCTMAQAGVRPEECGGRAPPKVNGQRLFAAPYPALRVSVRPVNDRINKRPIPDRES